MLMLDKMNFSMNILEKRTTIYFLAFLGVWAIRVEKLKQTTFIGEKITNSTSKRATNSNRLPNVNLYFIFIF